MAVVMSPVSVCADVLGWQPTLQLLLRPLQQLSTSFDWRVAEASLYCVRLVIACFWLLWLHMTWPCDLLTFVSVWQSYCKCCVLCDG